MEKENKIEVVYYEINDDNIINENKVVKGHSINLEGMKNFIKNLDKKICKIIFSDSYGTGFFVEFLPDENYLTKVLITNNHVLNKDYLEKYNIISIEIDKEPKEINLNVKRNIWTDKILDYTIIEILAEDKFDDFLLVDENILDKNLEHKKYLNSSIILPAYMENQQIFLIKEI